MKRLAVLLTLTVLAAACNDSFDPGRHAPPSFATASGPLTITLDQAEAAVDIGEPLTNGGTHVGKAFDANPHLGDAIVATFVWRGSTNTITTVTDHLEDETPVGNTYALVDYFTSAGWSVATYVATNARNFPDPAPSQDKILAVHAIFSESITDGGEMITAYRGVNPVLSAALGAHRFAVGSGSTATIADPGAIAVDEGALAYGFTMANTPADLADAPGFSPITAVWNSSNKIEGEYTVASVAGSVDPQWTWSFQSPSTWFASVLALNPQTAPTATHLGFRVQPSNILLPGMTITPAVQVAALDDQGNTVSDFVGPVTIALANDGSLFKNARLSGTLVVNVVDGVATFPNLSIDQIGMGYTLRATAGGLTAATSSSFNVTIP